MLEAALRGELDDGLGEDLMREASPSSQDSFSSAQALEAVQRNEPSPEFSAHQQRGRSQPWEEVSGRLKHQDGSDKQSGASTDLFEPLESITNQESLQRIPDDDLSHHNEVSSASGESDLEIARHAKLANRSEDEDEEGEEPSLHALLHDQGDLYSDD